MNQSQHHPRRRRDLNDHNYHPFLRCAELILPWLTQQELAAISSTCKTLLQLSKSITYRRSIDAARCLERHPIPFHNPSRNSAPYVYFLYSPSQVLPFQFPTRQPWGLDSPTQLGRASRGPCGIRNGSSDGVVGDLENQHVEEASVSARRPGGESGWVVGESGCGCECEGCEVGDGEILFGLEEMEIGIMSECGPSCGCGLQCGNRLTQRGVSVGLKIMRDERKGWGLFAGQLILQGQFVCEYAGELLTTQEARRRQQIYDGLKDGGRASSALLVVREHLPSGKACLRINIDATRVGNIARFINHSCDGGNLFTVLVRNAGSLLPRLCFFASRNIKEGEELTFSYGETRIRSNGLPCFCGSSCCSGTLPSELT